MNDEFMKHYEEGIEKAKALVYGIKDAGYNQGGVDVRDYFRFHGLYGMAYDIHKKALRAISITSPYNKKASEFKLQEGIVDTALDLLNYAAFLYAEAVILSKQGELEYWQLATHAHQEKPKGQCEHGGDQLACPSQK
mgnify:FL=1